MIVEYAKLAIGILASFLMAMFFLASEWDTIQGIQRRKQGQGGGS